MPLWRDTMSVMTVGQCPVCFELTYLSLIEPHATRNDVEWRTFACSKCGPVKAVLMPIKGTGRKYQCGPVRCGREQRFLTANIFHYRLAYRPVAWSLAPHLEWSLSEAKRTS